MFHGLFHLSILQINPDIKREIYHFLLISIGIYAAKPLEKAFADFAVWDVEAV